MKFRISASSRSRELPISEQAAAWLATLSDEACTSEERHDFARWIKASNTHVDEFLRISTLTRRLQGSAIWPDLDVERLIKEAREESKIASLPTAPIVPLPDHTRHLLFSWGHRVWAGAVIAFIALTAGLILRWPQHTYGTKLGELRSVTLEDGSIVQLNAQSSIQTQFTNHERWVKLQHGEAVFRVARNADRPFKVSTPFADIVAIGTQFNVDSRSNKTIVTVIEGQVKVLPQSEAKVASPLLSAGEQVVIQREHTLKRKERVDPAKVTGWTQRRLYFEETPLEDAVNQFKRFNARHIQIQDPVLAERRITGSFDSSDPAALVNFLARFGDAAVTEVENGWVIGHPKKPSPTSP